MVRAMGCLAGGGMPVRDGVVRTWLPGRGIVRALGRVRVVWRSIVRELGWAWMPSCCVVRAMGCVRDVGLAVRAGLVAVGLLSGWNGVPTGRGFYEDYCCCGLWRTFGRT